jgi:ribosome biogenesis GTPase A
MMIWVVDLFAFNGVLNPDIVKIAKKLDVIVLGTKRDLFPRVVKNEYLTRFLNERFNEYGIKPIATHIFGHESDINPKELLDKLNTLRKGKDIYMVGGATSGKTSIINKILTGYVNKSKWAIKSEIYKDTKSKVLEVPLSNSSFLYELPGFPLSTSILSKVEKENVKALTPRKSIKVLQRSMIKNDAILAGNLVQFSMIKGKPCIVKLYAAEGVEIKKCKIAQIPEVNEENNRKRNIRPYSENFTDFSDYDVFDYEMENDGKFHDISIQGFGWFTFVGKGQVFRVQFPKGVAVKEYLSKVRSDA